MTPQIYSEALGIGQPQARQDFAGNGVFLGDNKAVLPPGLIADRLATGNFGPYPNNTAPPGYMIAPFAGNYGGPQEAPPQEPEPPTQSAGDPLMMRLLALQAQAQGFPGSVQGNLDLGSLPGNPMDAAHFKNTMATSNAMAEALSNRYGP